MSLVAFDRGVCPGALLTSADLEICVVCLSSFDIGMTPGERLDLMVSEASISRLDAVPLSDFRFELSLAPDI